MYDVCVVMICVCLVMWRCEVKIVLSVVCVCGVKVCCEGGEMGCVCEV